VLRHVVNVGIAALAQMARRLAEVAQRLGNLLGNDCHLGRPYPGLGCLRRSDSIEIGYGCKLLLLREAKGGVGPAQSGNDVWISR
jgi:hypothetical protein